MEINEKDLVKRIKELKEEQLSLDGQIRFSQGEIQRIVDTHPEVQMQRQKISQLVADRNTQLGTIKAFEEFLNLGKKKEESKEKKSKKRK